VEKKIYVYNRAREEQKYCRLVIFAHKRNEFFAMTEDEANFEKKSRGKEGHIDICDNKNKTRC
jgi:hypothetical protein